MSLPKSGVCCLCGGVYGSYGHNPAPLGDVEAERCCSDCNDTCVMPARGLGRIDPMMAPEKAVRRFLALLYHRYDFNKEK